MRECHVTCAERVVSSKCTERVAKVVPSSRCQKYGKIKMRTKHIDCRIITHPSSPMMLAIFPLAIVVRMSSAVRASLKTFGKTIISEDYVEHASSLTLLYLSMRRCDISICSSVSLEGTVMKCVKKGP